MTKYVYVDTCLPFGLKSAPKFFNILADLLEWIARAEGVYHIFHYLDDFLILGPHVLRMLAGFGYHYQNMPKPQSSLGTLESGGAIHYSPFSRHRAGHSGDGTKVAS